MTQVLDTDEVWNGDEWGWVVSNPEIKDKERKELGSLVNQFLANGGKIDSLRTEDHSSASVFNNRIVAFGYDNKSLASHDEHNTKFIDRVYGGDPKLVEKLKPFLDTDMTLEQICSKVKMSPSRFRRLMVTYLIDEPKAERFLASISHLPPRKREELDNKACEALFKAYDKGLFGRGAWEHAASCTKFTVKTIMLVAIRLGTDKVWKRAKNESEQFA